MDHKLIDLGLITVRNEEEDIRGWAKESLFFCKKVVCVIDPDTEDNTEQILRDEFPNIIIEYQDRTLGDSDDKTKGNLKQMICHANYTIFLKKYAKDGDWIMEMAPDERLVVQEFDMILEDLQLGIKNGCEGLVFPNYYTFNPDLEHVIDWYSYFYYGSLNQIKFWKYNKHYFKNFEPHSGQRNFVQKVFSTQAGFYHFCYVKDTRIAFKNWRDVPEYQTYDVIPHSNPFLDWRNMPELDNLGNITIFK